MAMSENKLRSILELAFIGDEVIIQDLAGDGDHYEVEIRSSTRFRGLSLIEQHRLVYKALEAHALHAIKIKTTAIG